jgi:hypothetical protein
MQVNEKNVLTHFKRIDETDNSHTKSKNNATTDARIIRIPITIPPEQKPKSSFGIPLKVPFWNSGSEDIQNEADTDSNPGILIYLSYLYLFKLF